MLIASWLFIGVAFGVAFVIVARGQKRGERTLFAVGLLVAALIYPFWGLAKSVNVKWLVTETLGVAIYGVFALLGYATRYCGWLLDGQFTPHGRRTSYATWGRSGCSNVVRCLLHWF
jgi:hypothetical protein